MDMFKHSSGSISSTVCLPDDRELVASVHNRVKCQNCGKFKRSGRHSCCAPGGSWYRNCGGDDDTNVDHRWSEGVKACRGEFEVEIEIEIEFAIEVESMCIHAFLED